MQLSMTWKVDVASSYLSTTLRNLGGERTTIFDAVRESFGGLPASILRAIWAGMTSRLSMGLFGVELRDFVMGDWVCECVESRRAGRS
jgi:hypothetical protein